MARVQEQRARVYRTPFADGWMQLGDYYADLKLDDEAAEAYESAGRLDEKVPQWQTKAAQAAQRCGRPGDSVQHLREVVRRDPSPTNWLALARANFLEQVSLAPRDATGTTSAKHSTKLPQAKPTAVR